MRAIVPLLAVSLVVPTHNLLAQQFHVQPGARVRVTAPWAGSYSTTSRVIGAVVAVRGDTIVLETERFDPFEFDIGSVTRLEISTRRGFDAKKGLKGAGIGFLVGAGVPLLDSDNDYDIAVFAASAVVGTVVGGTIEGGGRNAGKVGLIGALVGAPLGAAIGFVMSEPCQPDAWMCFGPEFYAVMGATGGVVVGGMVGLLAGAFIPADQWERVSLDRLRVSFAPRRDGASVGVSVRF